MKVVFCPLLLDIWESICLKVPRLIPFVLLIKVMLRWRCLCCFGGMILTGSTEIPVDKPVPTLFLSATNPTWTVLGSDPGLRGEKPPTNHPFRRAGLIENSQICDDMYTIVLPLYTVATVVKATCQNWRYFLSWLQSSLSVYFCN